jgi:CarD family transcriptional regulator
LFHGPQHPLERPQPQLVFGHQFAKGHARTRAAQADDQPEGGSQLLVPFSHTEISHRARAKRKAPCAHWPSNGVKSGHVRRDRRKKTLCDASGNGILSVQQRWAGYRMVDAAQGTVQVARTEFQVGSLVVHPARGVFRLAKIAQMQIDGVEVPSFILLAENGSDTIAIPIAQAERGALRPLSSSDTIAQALALLQTRRKIRKEIWARRVKHYDAKIKTGDPISLAEVLRDVYRPGEQSQGEKDVFQRALSRLSAEASAVMDVDKNDMKNTITGNLQIRRAT